MTNVRVESRAAAFETLHRLIADRQATVAIVGQGYVGLPLAVAVASAGFPTIGFDVNPGTVERLNTGSSHIGDVSSDVIRGLLDRGFYSASSQPDDLSDADVVVICVPTPLLDGAPDIGYIKSAGQTLAQRLKDDCLVILESTTYPGTTEEVLLPLLSSEQRNRTAGLFVAFSPERIDPGNRQFNVTNTPKVVGGIDPESGRLAGAFFGHFVTEVVAVPGTREAEMAKLIENTFRHVNIALVNELAVFCREAGIDVHASIAAAATKPYGYMPFYPGPGVGGHCIPVDPNYLAWTFRQAGERFRIVEAAEEVNSQMPRYVVRRIGSILNGIAKPLAGSRIVVVGVAYKPNISDARESPAIPVIEQLIRERAIVSYIDPYVAEVATKGGVLKATTVDDALAETVDCTVILTPHNGIDYERLTRASRTVYDTRAALRHPGPHAETL